MECRNMLVKQVARIGVFRGECNDDVSKYLPENLYNSIFGEIPTNLDVDDLFEVNSTATYFNMAAFGRAYKDVLSLSLELRRFSEEHPGMFYDQVCVPLINHSYKVLSEFFGTDNVVMVPNCTVGMKCVAEHLMRSMSHRHVATLTPLYGSTQKILEWYQHNGLIETVSGVEPGEHPLVEEDPVCIVAALEHAYQQTSFTVLFCDEIASQSARAAPLQEIAEFCERRKVVLVVDGTQSCELLVGDNKNVLDKVDYFVMSTYKWLGNTKSCGLIRFNKVENAPQASAVSYGWQPITNKSISEIRAEFLWQGMMDCYVSYITLSKAIKIFTVYGEQQLDKASKMLSEGVLTTLGVKPLLPAPKYSRNITILSLENTPFEFMEDAFEIQNLIQENGVFVAVKALARDGSGTPLKNYVRISCWSHNKPQDFETLGMILRNSKV